VTDSSKRKWVAPAVRKLARPEEIWDHFKEKGSPEELDRLRQLLKENYAFDPDWRERPKRRA